MNSDRMNIYEYFFQKFEERTKGLYTHSSTCNTKNREQLWELFAKSSPKPSGATARFKQQWCKTNKCQTYRNNAITIINEYFTETFNLFEASKPQWQRDVDTLFQRAAIRIHGLDNNKYLTTVYHNQYQHLFDHLNVKKFDGERAARELIVGYRQDLANCESSNTDDTVQYLQLELNNKVDQLQMVEESIKTLRVVLTQATKLRSKLHSEIHKQKELEEKVESDIDRLSKLVGTLESPSKLTSPVHKRARIQTHIQDNSQCPAKILDFTSDHLSNCSSNEQ